MKRLQNKIAVVYGNGSVGSAVAKAFAHEGASVFFAGRSLGKLQTVAKEVLRDKGKMETAEVDALNEQEVISHMNDIIRKAGRIDISFNTIGLPQKGIQGTPLSDLTVDAFSHPIITYTRSHFITAKTAVTRMIEQRQGVILVHTPNASRISPPFVGGMVPAWAALEGLFRSISVEFGQRGVRSVCLLTTGIPETPLIDEVWQIHGRSHGISFEQFHEVMEGQTHRKRLTTLNELTNAAVFAASDEGSALTGSILNLTAGMIVD